MKVNVYTMFKFYGGEDLNPYEAGSVEAFFWNYEKAFEDQFSRDDPADLYAFFKAQGLGSEFLSLAVQYSQNQASVLYKAGVFKVWLKYLFTEKLSKADKDLYFSYSKKNLSVWQQ